MRYFTAVIVTIAVPLTGFILLVVASSLADNWSRPAQQTLYSISKVWAEYWWILTIILGSVCLIIATITDAMAPAKKKRPVPPARS